MERRTATIGDPHRIREDAGPSPLVYGPPPWLPAAARPHLVYATALGAQLHGDSRHLLGLLGTESVDLIVTSPTFALQRAKSYGNQEQAGYASWLAAFGHAAWRVLKPTGSFVLDLGGAYQPGRPVRSLHPWRVLLEFCDKIRVKDSVDVVWWFSKTDHPKADVRRVLAPYSSRMKKLLHDPERFYRPTVRPSGHEISTEFGKDNGGAIPSNLLAFPNTTSNDRYTRSIRSQGRKVHPARFPKELPAFFVKMLTGPGDLVVDIFSGSNTTGATSEALGRRWLAMEILRDHAVGSACRFSMEDGGPRPDGAMSDD